MFNARLILYGVVLAFGLGAIWYVSHTRNAWLDERDRAQAAEQAAAGYQASLGVLTAQRAAQEAAAHEREKSYKWIAHKLGAYRKAESMARISDPTYAAWATIRHPVLAGVLLQEPSDSPTADDSSPAVSPSDATNTDP